jgi:uncharacterized damage-inducible protein DinB
VPTPRLKPPFHADEVTMLTSFLDFYRVTIRRQCEDLSPAQLAQRLEPSTMTLGGMLKHLAIVEDWWCSMALTGAGEAAWYAGVDWDADADWEWNTASADEPAQLLAWYDEAIVQSQSNVAAALAAGGLDGAAARPRNDGTTWSLRWILVHLIEEYARHAGHADLIRESIDGATDL